MKMFHPMLQGNKLGPNTDISIVACFLDNASMSAVFIKIMHPVLEHLVIFSPAWSLPTNIHRLTTLPLGSGTFGGMASVMLP